MVTIDQALALQTERPAITRTNRPSAIRGL
jgi:hypothetical protein